MSISLTTQLTDRGIVCSHPVLGQVATLQRKPGGWYVFPYKFPPYERGATFKTLRAAEFYALALAHEMTELD